MRIKDYFTRHFFHLTICTLCVLTWAGVARAQPGKLPDQGISLIPYPKEVKAGGGNFLPGKELRIVLDKTASEKDRFAANELVKFLRSEAGINAKISNTTSKRSIVLTRAAADGKFGDEGYSLTASQQGVTITASGEAGLFYGVQTFIQLVQKKGAETYVPGIAIKDWPDTKVRAVHYDTKHHQDKRSYVEDLIRELAGYKVNMLVWEWEDKFEYPSHPEIGAPGAFTMKEMQELTRYAQQYHIQIVPLVQGLGHVSFILKWPQFAHLREIPASNFEFCPLKDGSYDLLADLWKDAMEATPGSKYIHIGSDETYELGACPACKKKEEEIGKSGLYHLFIDKSAKRIENSGREVMTWEAPMGWAKGRLQVYHTGMKQEKPVAPHKGIILTESYDYETPDLKYAKEAKALGHPVYAYDPNPGIEQLFLPYFFSKDGKGEIKTGSLENSYNFLQETMGKGVFDGVIRTSWDDSGLPMQAWMLSFATTAAFSWNAAVPGLADFTAAFYKNRYGNQSAGMDSLYYLLNEGAYFFMESFERRVWAWGEIGKTHIPDLPRGDALEYDPFWNTQYAGRLASAEEMRTKMNTAIRICDQNLQNQSKNEQDILVFKTLANLVKHTALTYQDLSKLENAVRTAHQQRFTDLKEAYRSLQLAEGIVDGQLQRRQKVFDEINAVWGKTMLPKGMSTDTKQYFFEQDRTRHFANRTPDMTYLIVDEQQLGLEDYQVKLRAYSQFFYDRFIK
nr:beta-N-acetylhexosaminidase [uncultured Dyadobacter sp.]